MDNNHRREFITSCVKGLMGVTGGVVVAALVSSKNALGQIENHESMTTKDPEGEVKTPEERANLIAQDLMAENSSFSDEAISMAVRRGRFLNGGGGFRRGGFLNGGGGGGGGAFRRGGFRRF